MQEMRLALLLSNARNAEGNTAESVKGSLERGIVAAQTFLGTLEVKRSSILNYLKIKMLTNKKSAVAITQCLSAQKFHPVRSLLLLPHHIR